MSSETRSTKSSLSSKQGIEQGKAIARGIAEANAQKDRSMASAAKRKETLFRKAVKETFGNY